jgi:hypothetical protein
MRSTANRWFSEEARQAGWISAGACVVVASACLLLASVERAPQGILLVYALFLIGLGWVAVGALNFRRWHSFRKSMEACVAAVVNTYKLLGAVAAIYLCFSILLGPIFLNLLFMLIFWSLYLLFYVAVSFLIATVTACAAGASLCGLLWVMRYVGETGRSEESHKKYAPRALRIVL